ncbi:hypothetical protein GCM10011579_095800 [Streptomyces albiflavescens]|uniref:Transposase n=1 Tax=Streptomyces albiflavescens TaxID=1623582 RepID=A0A917YFV1_9ACTN|nr:hypothetical protein GCM10011579_095800 [Streptomyces albiflavescens]
MNLSGPEAIGIFADSVRQDFPAVTAALTLSYSSGVVEGHVNRIKTIKRDRVSPSKTGERLSMSGRRFQGGAFSAGVSSSARTTLSRPHRPTQPVGLDSLAQPGAFPQPRAAHHRSVADARTSAHAAGVVSAALPQRLRRQLTPHSRSSPTD